MQPAHRAAKVIKAARIAAKINLGEIDRAIAANPKKAKTLLKQFPGVGDPLADKILLFSGAHPCLGPDSNALRVLIRLGFVRHHGQELCTRSAPRCEGCPLRPGCAFYRLHIA
jgi:endonuclease III